MMPLIGMNIVKWVTYSTSSFIKLGDSILIVSLNCIDHGKESEQKENNSAADS
uniref:Uncharacterized protein n=1 Tax=Nelumbo nucifera TaxID=4432 RepID=A0A822ZWX1_NELNU|nr:TPA_asm: hypothetical protein HUJ06_018917 [Nelumbo nucifera]